MGWTHGARAVNREPKRPELHRINADATPSEDCPTLAPCNILHSTKGSTGGYRRPRTHLKNTPLGPRRRPCRIANVAESWVSMVATVGFCPRNYFQVTNKFTKLLMNYSREAQHRLYLLRSNVLGGNTRTCAAHHESKRRFGNEFIKDAGSVGQ